MEALRLFEEMPKKEKKINWKQERANLIYGVYNEVVGTKLKVPYGMVMGLLTRIAENVPTEENGYYGWAWVDEQGEIQFEIPPIEEFEAQYRGFLNNEFARKCNYSLSLFFKQYGNFEVAKEKVPLKVKPQVKQTRVMIHCSDCKKNHYSDEFCQ